MADNVPITAGSGTSIATDDIGGIHHQKIKIEFGASDSATQVDASNPLPVTVIAGADGSVQGVDPSDQPVTADPLLAGARASAAAPADVTADGDAVANWALRSGAQVVQVSAAGALIAGDAPNGLDVDVTRLIPGVTATALGKSEDAVAGSGDTGVLMLVVRRDTSAHAVSADGDYAALGVDGSGRLHVNAGAIAGSAVEDAAAASGDTGLVQLGARNDAGATRTSADGDYGVPAIDRAGRHIVRQVAPTGTTTQVADNAANVTILAANSARLGAIITNDSTAILYIKYGATASLTDYTVQVPISGGNHEVPFGYTGIIDGIWATDPGTGAARVTELT